MKIVIYFVLDILEGVAVYEYKSYEIFSSSICIADFDLYCNLFCADAVCFDENEYSGR